MQSSYTGRGEFAYNNPGHFAEVIVQAAPCEGITEVILAPAVLKYLRERFGRDFECHRHNIHAAVACQIAVCNVAKEMPHAGSASFRAEVTDVEVTDTQNRELLGAMLTMAGMNAIGHYLCDWEQEQERAKNGA